MLKLQVQVQVIVSDDHYRSIGSASSAIDFSETKIESLGFYASSLASILGDTMAEEVRQTLSLPEKGERDNNGE